MKRRRSIGCCGASRLRDSGATRTRDPQLRRLLLYPTELRNRMETSLRGRFANIRQFLGFANYRASIAWQAVMAIIL